MGKDTDLILSLSPLFCTFAFFKYKRLILKKAKKYEV